MFKIQNIKTFLFGSFEHLDLGFVSDWSLTDASPEIRISNLLLKGRLQDKKKG